MIRNNQSNGFTLIELLVVIAIIGILSTTVLSQLNTARVKALDAQRISDLENIKIALELYRNDNGAYPVVPVSPLGNVARSFSGPSSRWGNLANMLSNYIVLPSDPQAAVGAFTGFIYPPLSSNSFYYYYVTDSNGDRYDLVAKLAFPSNASCPTQQHTSEVFEPIPSSSSGNGGYNWCTGGHLIVAEP